MHPGAPNSLKRSVLLDILFDRSPLHKAQLAPAAVRLRLPSAT